MFHTISIQTSNFSEMQKMCKELLHFQQKRFSSCIDAVNVQFSVNHFHYNFYSQFLVQFSFCLIYTHSDASVFNEKLCTVTRMDNRCDKLSRLKFTILQIYDFATVPFKHRMSQEHLTLSLPAVCDLS